MQGSQRRPELAIGLTAAEHLVAELDGKRFEGPAGHQEVVPGIDGARVVRIVALLSVLELVQHGGVVSHRILAGELGSPGRGRVAEVLDLGVVQQVGVGSQLAHVSELEAGVQRVTRHVEGGAVDPIDLIQIGVEEVDMLES